ncbi:MAG: potassium transporter TrkG [Mobiluncus porci]|uniref:TrkH family potassium uptake protein n=1 Tax=Mobiluncus porci TaxID=2652278 RepID=A0A7K0K2G0_9ACTO|nr:MULTISPECIES: potassium transporter TrkG [Mobiluncus]MCI6585494.1 TrkH family potassium uptake protein [Mobiluncus sp.]MDD7541297.1 potassium transporter TrkG [Mobiluncus porci]MDY5747780.1 potassium transporter TrkG [Mobiluncus porci]MST49662.1 TrkH family potassium uptake protein [Mobiluncus porci]
MKAWENLRIRSQKWFDELARRAPARLTLAIFLGIIAIATLLLSLPIATRSRVPATFVDALFTGTSAVCVTGLTVVPTETYWSTFGLIVILLGMKIGGLGVMTLASMLSLAVSRHIGLTARLLAAGEKNSHLGEVGSLVKMALLVSLSVEGMLALLFFPHFLRLDYGILRSFWYAIFMAVSVFNNAGFVILPGGMGQFASDFAFLIPVIVGMIIGALGFPVALDLARNWRNLRLLSLNSKLTITTYLSLVLVGGSINAVIEWNNPRTFGELDLAGKLLAAFLGGANTRSLGISTVDVGQMHQSSWFVSDIMMFIGGGSASTAGGIKVTTFAVMVLAIVAEIRGNRDIEAFGRRIGPSTVRLAVAVVAMGALIVGVSTTLMLILTDLPLAQVLFEVISAFGTVGLSTGITATLPASAKVLLSVLMFTGRVGTMTFGAALAMRTRRRVIRFPEEAPSIG